MLNEKKVKYSGFFHPFQSVQLCVISTKSPIQKKNPLTNIGHDSKT